MGERMKYVCRECGSEDVSMVVDALMNPNAEDGSKFKCFANSGYDKIIENRAFLDMCNSCGWTQKNEDDTLIEKEEE
jgi:hypothetical protein|tara:strand:- start:1032 stop:1262 length:231 start_codon:yes stop_codon:yes gene_type:complete